MNKFGTIIVIIVFFVVTFLLAQVIIPEILVPMAETANTTMASTSNMTNYPGTAEAVTAAPWVLYLAIPAVAIIAVILVLLGPSLSERVRDYIARMR